jgi:beta-glucosidase
MRELKGFRRVALEPGQTKTVTIELKASQLAYWDSTRKAFVIEGAKIPGSNISGAKQTTATSKKSIEIMIGSSSADIKLTKVIEVRN